VCEWFRLCQSRLSVTAKRCIVLREVHLSTMLCLLGYRVCPERTMEPGMVGDTSQLNSKTESSHLNSRDYQVPTDGLEA